MFRQRDLAEIAAGRLTLAFRRWDRPTLRPGGTLGTSIGLLTIGRVDEIADEQITESDARRAGAESAADLLQTLRAGAQRKLYRIELSLAGRDPRLALQERTDLSAAETTEITHALKRCDDFGRRGPWTIRALQLLDQRAETSDKELALGLRLPKDWLKVNLRKLKELGLTESVGKGYRLSPRGKAYLERLAV